MFHITSGDIAGRALSESGLPGEVFVWHDILYDGPRRPGWPDEEILQGRAVFLERETGGGLSRDDVLNTLKAQYKKLAALTDRDGLVLWFDACLFCQSMLAHVLTCLRIAGVEKADLICVDAFPGIDPYHGLGQLRPDQLASLFDRREPATGEQFRFAERVDRAFALQDQTEFEALAGLTEAPLSHIPAAARRWLLERPDPATGLGRLETLALEAIRSGASDPSEIFRKVSAMEQPPQYWGDITLWAKINGLADRTPPLVNIEGPGRRLPQWEGGDELERYRVYRA